MKNFKKVIAFLMVAAMTLGMGLTAFATGDAVDVTTVKAVVADKIEEAKAGETVTIKLIADQEFYCNACKMHIYLDSEYVKIGQDDVVNEANEFLDAVWKVPSDAAAIAYYPEADDKGHRAGEVLSDAAGASKTNPNKFKVTKGTVMAELQVVLAKDVAAGDKIATVHFEFITDGTTTPGTNVDLYPEDVEVVISEKASSSADDTSSSSSSSDNQQGTTTNQQNNNNQGATTTAAGQQNTTAKDIVTKDDALNALDTLAKATAAAAKLNKAAFANDADYQAFAAALAEANKVLKNSKATDAEKAAALATLKAAMSKADEKALVAAVKAVVNAPATTKAGNGKTKTGDTAPVAVLMLVAIAAFGTAVVVYRKKVNA